MPVTKLPIANGTYLSESLPISAQECVNWYPNIVQAPALNQETLFGTPGKKQLQTTGTNNQVNRGAWTLNKKPYFVNGDSLYRLDRSIDSEGVETFITTTLGTIEGTARCAFADNGIQMVIMVPGGKGYVFTESPDTLTEITDADFRANGEPQFPAFVDGYFVFTTDTKKFIASDLNNALSYTATFFGTAESNPDEVVAPWVFNNQLFIGGEITAEAFQTVASTGFPFSRTGLFLTKGVAAPYSVVVANDTFFFLGNGQDESPAIWSFAGNTMQKVSTTAIDSILQRLTDDELSAVFGVSYAQRGAYFVGFALPDTTIVFNSITGRWHEQKSQIINASGKTVTIRDRMNSVVTAYGRLIVADSQDGRIAELDPDTYTEYDRNIIRVVATQPFQNNQQQFFLPWVELTVESGVGNSDAPDPKIRMDRSLDGKTFKFDRTRSMGKVGEYNRRAIWRRNGRAARFEILRFTLSDPVKPVIIQLTAEIQ